ncbi:hypothetical protein [Roseiterribacter gracilis]|uniref:Uncharacterized protein n=1 Tax=Roseiterribacter gracilis TaxID=2812848 RepID=A0A8S8XAN2_9PROT|nr:hypothetical protein TMPK1_27700 [Rhodospirillales bacterium TMPK1]
MPPYLQQFELLGALPDWAAYLIVAALIGWTLCMFGVVAGKAGRSPVWGLAFVVPYVGLPLLWWWALGRWPVRAPRS